MMKLQHRRREYKKRKKRGGRKFSIVFQLLKKKTKRAEAHSRQGHFGHASSQVTHVKDETPVIKIIWWASTSAILSLLLMLGISIAEKFGRPVHAAQEQRQRYWKYMAVAGSRWPFLVCWKGADVHLRLGRFILRLWKTILRPWKKSILRGGSSSHWWKHLTGNHKHKTWSKNICIKQRWKLR